jgi:hypothetical protein
VLYVYYFANSFMKQFYFLIIITLVSLSGLAQKDMRDNMFLYGQEDPQQKIAQNLFCKAETSKNSVYAGEPVLVTFKLYSALQSNSVVEKTPTFNGFSTYDVKIEDPVSPQRVNGRLYNCHVIRKLQLYPVEAGVFTLEPVEVKNTITFYRITNGGQGSIDDVLSGKANTEANYAKEDFENTSRTPPVTITVKPLPENGKPEWFNGAAGSFSIKMVCDSTTVKKNDALKIQWVVSGTGNFKMINALPVNWPAGMEAFEPVITENITEGSAPFSGQKIFEYTVSPTVEGNLTIPALQFSYFNPAAQQYKMAVADSLRLLVLPGAEKAVTKMAPAAPARETGGSPLWIYLAAGGTLLLAAGIFLKLKNRRGPAIVAAAPETAVAVNPEPAPRPFKESMILAMLGETLQFLTTLRREFGMEAALAVGLPAETGLKEVTAVLKTTEQKAAVNDFLQRLDGFLYAGGTASFEPEQLLRQAQSIIEGIKA